jgi:hypothetical protein
MWKFFQCQYIWIKTSCQIPQLSMSSKDESLQLWESHTMGSKYEKIN